MRVKCFMLQPTGRCRRWLRCYSSWADPLERCLWRFPPLGYHNTYVLGEDAHIKSRTDIIIQTDCFPEGDSRWPLHCPCGYVFTPDDVKQTFCLEIFLTPDGREVSIHPNPPCGLLPAPVGSMWFGNYLWWNNEGKDGLVVVTPTKLWSLDGRSPVDGGYMWKGTPPHVTAWPFLRVDEYTTIHLHDGELTVQGAEDVDEYKVACL